MENNLKTLKQICKEIDQALAERSIKELQTFNTQIDETSSSLVMEAVKHFKVRFRKGDKDDFDERYFYTEQEFELFKKLNQNPKVKFRIEYDEIIPNKIYCYIAYR